MKPGAPGGTVKPAQSTGVGTQIRSANQTNAQIKANIQISQSQIITQANTGWSLLKAYANDLCAKFSIAHCHSSIYINTPTVMSYSPLC